MYQTTAVKKRQGEHTSGVLSQIPDGIRGTRTVMETMTVLIRQGKKNVNVRLLAAGIINHLAPKDWSGEVKAIQRWTRDNIRYVRDIQGVETLHSASKILELGYGDCDDKSILVSAMLQSVGYPVKLKAVGFTSNTLSHIYPMVKLEGQWIAVETTEKGWTIGMEPENIVNKLEMAVK
jgi:hypothetical protein